MAQIICTSKHAKFAKQIGGVRFFNSPVGLISEEISDEKAEEFCGSDAQFTRHAGDPIAAPEEKVAAPQGGAKTRTVPPAKTEPANPNF